MADRPIIFSAPMVRALLEGRKTQTRRLLKLAGRSPDYIGPAGCQDDPTCWGWEMPDLGGYVTIEGDDKDHLPGWRNGWRDWQGAYAPGDRLYVREAFIGPYAYEVNEYPPRDWGNKAIWFPADGPVPEKHAGQFWHRARPSIHMPRWASRLTLTVTDVRVQRLQDISEADAIAEGIERLKSGRGFYDPTVSHAAVRFGEWTSTARQGFCRLWNSLHGHGAWDANPWVVAVTFTVQRENIDQMPGAK